MTFTRIGLSSALECTASIVVQKQGNNVNPEEFLLSVYEECWDVNPWNLKRNLEYLTRSVTLLHVVHGCMFCLFEEAKWEDLALSNSHILHLHPQQFYPPLDSSVITWTYTF